MNEHYEANIQPIEFISDNKLDFCRGSIIKYTCRVGKKKGQEVLDIKKIIDYALLLAIQEGIKLDREEIVKLIEKRVEKV